MYKDPAIKQKLIEQARVLFKANLRQGCSRWNKTDYSFISPSDREYVFQWMWDTAFHAIVLSHFDTNWAKKEVENFLLAQQEDGFLPHVIFWGNKINYPHWAYLESKLALRPHHTAITQPPMFPIAVEEIYNKDKDKQFLLNVLPKLAKHHRWLLKNRDPDNDYLVSIISPNESGMDELPVFQITVGFKGLNGIKLHYYFRKTDLLNQRYSFNNKVILEKDYFNVEELLFNSVFIESSRALSRLYNVIGNQYGVEYFEEVADKAQNALLDKCWDNEEQIFYSLFSKQEQQAKVKTIASLLPIFTQGITRDKLEPLINKHLLNPDEFWTNFPVPSVAKNEIYYYPKATPAHQVKLLWRGPTWINTNWFIIKGLRKHGFNDIADTLTAKTLEMIQKEGFREYYNPETGEGYRRKNFGWSTLIIDLL